MKQKRERDYRGFLCIAIIYSFGAMYYTFSPSADDLGILFPVVWILPIFCLLLSIFYYIKKKQKDKPPPQEVPYDPE